MREIISVHTERALEYDKLKAFIKRYTFSQPGASKVNDLAPQSGIDEIRENLALCSEMKRAVQVHGSFSLAGLRDLAPILRIATKPGSILEPSQLCDVSHVLQVAENVHRFMGKLPKYDFPKLLAIADTLPTFPALAASIQQCVGPDAEIRDSASPTLRKIRRSLVKIREAIRSKLDSLLHSSKHQKSIQDHVVTLRNDRYVLPVKQDAKPHFLGLVHGQSASGATVFVEPFSVVDMNNDLHRLVDEERHEIRRILLSLTDAVRECSANLETALSVLAELDFLNAKARLSIDLNAVEARLNSRGFTKLIAARHPILELNLRRQQVTGDKPNTTDFPTRVVPTDLHLGDQFSTLVITGPNTGGKTVVLKSLGLLTIMAQSGLHIPAKPGSEIAVCEQVFADIGDEQSIEQNLSTFSSHITKIAATLNRIKSSFGKSGENSLVLLDEIGAGTDPTEGAALSMAILDWLGERRVRTLVTTHYGALKSYAHAKADTENACMEFDWQTLSPTYRLVIGVPGSSNAFKVAARLGIPRSILHDAKAHVGDQNVAIDDLIIKMQQSQRELETERKSLDEKVRAAETEFQKHRDLIQDFETNRTKLAQQAEHEAYTVLNDARRLVDESIADIRRETASKQSIRTALSHISSAKAELKDEQRQRVEMQSSRPEKLQQVQVGDKVCLEGSKKYGEVLSISPNSDAPITLQVGNMQMRISYQDIGKIQPRQQNNKITPSVVDVQRIKADSVKAELHILGYTVDQALEVVDKYLDDAFLASMPKVRIVHGKGTGALRQGIHEGLIGHPLVSSFELAPRSEGGDGATVVVLKE
ncbi:MAG: endonuclease MutS2 [Candidatus Poribacteria bacterium]|nr:endonuclease MutS2 [Candidatus Poribacteria bacterium]MDE0505894.1 endonuclease MutS2 [Candidatus Poribacteria bacterium]